MARPHLSELGQNAQIPRVSEYVKVPTRPLNDELAAEINKLAADFPDETGLLDLRIPSKKTKHGKAFVIRSVREEMIANAPLGWTEFLDTMPQLPRSLFLSGLTHLASRGYQSVGDVRQRDFNQMIDPRGDGLSPATVAFFKRAFAPRPEEDPREQH